MCGRGTTFVATSAALSLARPVLKFRNYKLYQSKAEAHAPAKRAPAPVEDEDEAGGFVPASSKAAVDNQTGELAADADVSVEAEAEAEAEVGGDASAPAGASSGAADDSAAASNAAISLLGSFVAPAPALTIAPKKPNWDLKRDVEKRLQKLERQTQVAIRELVRTCRVGRCLSMSR